MDDSIKEIIEIVSDENKDVCGGGSVVCGENCSSAEKQLASLSLPSISNEDETNKNNANATTTINNNNNNNNNSELLLMNVNDEELESAICKCLDYIDLENMGVSLNSTRDETTNAAAIANTKSAEMSGDAKSPVNNNNTNTNNNNNANSKNDSNNKENETILSRLRSRRKRMLSVEIVPSSASSSQQQPSQYKNCDENDDDYDYENENQNQNDENDDQQPLKKRKKKTTTTTTRTRRVKSAAVCTAKKHEKALKDITNIDKLSTKPLSKSDEMDLHIINTTGPAIAETPQPDENEQSREMNRNMDDIEMLLCKSTPNHYLHQQQLHHVLQLSAQEQQDKLDDIELEVVEFLANKSIEYQQKTQTMRVYAQTSAELLEHDALLNLSCQSDSYYDFLINDFDPLEEYEPCGPPPPLAPFTLVSPFKYNNFFESTTTRMFKQEHQKQQQQPQQQIIISRCSPETKAEMDDQEFGKIMELFLEKHNKQHGLSLNVIRCTETYKSPPSIDIVADNNENEQQQEEHHYDKHDDEARADDVQTETLLSKAEIERELARAAEECETEDEVETSDDDESSVVAVEAAEESNQRDYVAQKNIIKLKDKQTKLNLSVDTKEKFEFALKMMRKVFTPAELRTGIIADANNKTRSKTRQPLDEHKTYLVKKALTDEFNLDSSYADWLWSQIRSDLNQRIYSSGPPKSKAQQTTTNSSSNNIGKQSTTNKQQSKNGCGDVSGGVRKRIKKPKFDTD